VVVVCLLAVLLGACGAPVSPTPQVLRNGLVRHHPQSTAVPVGQSAALNLWTHCGLDQTLIDFAGVLWAPIAVPRGNGGVIAPPAIVENPLDRGTITLLGPGRAIYEAETGNVIVLRAVIGPRDLMSCY
jgi:hypothetical protein